MRAVIVTGAGGYIGERLLSTARAQGRSARGLKRPGWSLGQALPAAALADGVPASAHAVIHLAHDWADRDPAGGTNLRGTRALHDSARALGVERFVFVSSQSARGDAPNAYGRIKHAAEPDGPGAVSARVGLVYGGPWRGQYGLLAALATRLPAVPMVQPWREVQPIGRDEVCRGLLRLADGAEEGRVGLAGAPIAFGTALAMLAREFGGKRLPVLPVPARLALLACDVSAALPFGPTVDRERVLGLLGTRTMDCAADLDALGLELLPFAQGLRREPASRRALLAEARRLLRYVLRRSPGSDLLRRYVRGLAAVGEAGAIPIPTGLRLREPFGAADALGRRLALATALAEASPEWEAAATARGQLAVLAAVDALALPLRLLSRR